MSDTSHTREALEVIAKVLIRCFGMLLLVLLFWWGILACAGDWTYRVHSRFIPVTRDHFYAIHYAGLSLLKTATFVLVLVPYLAIRLTLRKGRASEPAA